jgi:hypothetical protein
VNGWLREGDIICPPCSEFCDRPDKNQTCAEDSEPPDWAYTEDPYLDEPCLAKALHATLLILVFSFIMSFT